MKTLRFQAWLSLALVALLAGVAVPSQAAAAACPDVAGKVVKVKSNYWLVKDGQRYEFVDSVAMQTWDRTAVTVKAECLSELPVISLINYRPGSRLVKVAGTTAVYAISPGQVLNPIDAAAAKQWYGTGWRSSVRTISATQFSYLTVGEAVTIDRLNDGALVKQVGKAQVYYVKDGQLVKVDGKLRSVLTGKVLALPAKVFAKLTISTNVVKSTDLTADPVTAVVPATEGSTKVISPEKKESSDKKESEKVEKTDVKTDNTVETDLNKQPRTGANYNGPFPAPEGLVLEGTIGSLKYFEPTGTGEYRFRPAIDGGRSINCLDSTRTVYKSKGKNYDAGFKSGIFYGIKDGDVLFPKYDDTPRGSGNVGNQYFNEGFRVGYKHGYEVGNEYGVYYDCRTTAYKPGDYDADGWRKTTGFAKAPNLMAVYYPGTNAGYGGGDGKATEETYKWKIDFGTSVETPEKAELNVGKTAVNLSEIQVTEAVPDASEANVTPQDMAKMTYDQAVQLMSTKYKSICTVTAPTYETKTYGANTVSSVAFIQICVQGKDTSWKLQSSSFIKGKNSGHMLAIYYVNPNDLKKSGVNELDATKLYSVPFIEQFLTKIQFN